MYNYNICYITQHTDTDYFRVMDTLTLGAVVTVTVVMDTVGTGDTIAVVTVGKCLFL